MNSAGFLEPQRLKGADVKGRKTPMIGNNDSIGVTWR